MKHTVCQLQQLQGVRNRKQNITYYFSGSLEGMTNPVIGLKKDSKTIQVPCKGRLLLSEERTGTGNLQQVAYNIFIRYLLLLFPTSTSIWKK